MKTAENQNENVIILAKMSLMLILMLALTVACIMCERHQETEHAKKEFKKHINRNYVIGNDSVSIDSNFKVNNNGAHR